MERVAGAGSELTLGKSDTEARRRSCRSYLGDRRPSFGQ